MKNDSRRAVVVGDLPWRGGRIGKGRHNLLNGRLAGLDSMIGFQPSKTAIQEVVAAFANAPPPPRKIPNDDGTPGIVLHVDCGSDCVMNPLRSEPWGQKSESK